jgi:hypothetical protein
LKQQIDIQRGFWSKGFKFNKRYWIKRLIFSLDFEATDSSSTRDIEAIDWCSAVDFEATDSSSTRDIEAIDWCSAVNFEAADSSSARDIEATDWYSAWILKQRIQVQQEILKQ